MVQVVCEALHEEEEVGAVGVVKAAMQLEDTELVTQEDTAEAMVAATDTAKDMDMTTTEVDMIRTELTVTTVTADMAVKGNNTAEVNSAALDAMSPLKVLGRGYSIARNENGTLIASVKDAAPGERLELRLSDGSLACRVEERKCL